MNNIAQEVEDSLKLIAAQLLWIKRESVDLNKLYFSSGANAVVDTLTDNTTPATMSSGLNKKQVIDGVTMIGQLVNFFGNGAVVTGDYLASAENLVTGSYVAAAIVRNDVEAIGSRMRALGLACIKALGDSLDTVTKYNSSLLATAVGSLQSQTVMFGCSTTQSKFYTGIGLLQQYINLMENTAVETNDYASFVAQWT